MHRYSTPTLAAHAYRRRQAQGPAGPAALYRRHRTALYRAPHYKARTAEREMHRPPPDTALHYRAIHYRAIHYTAIHYTIQHRAQYAHDTHTPHPPPLYHSTLHCTIVYYRPLHSPAPHRAAPWRSPVLHSVYTTQRDTALHSPAARCGMPAQTGPQPCAPTHHGDRGSLPVLRRRLRRRLRPRSLRAWVGRRECSIV